jgi:prepilin-type N-terminal cleavage/methylation domain-containing protein
MGKPLTSSVLTGYRNVHETESPERLLTICCRQTGCHFKARARGLVGFTLVELLVVIAIIGVLVALLLPAIQAARAAARRTTCLNQVRQLVVALQNYHSSQGTFPPGVVSSSGQLFSAPRLTWMMSTFSYLEQTALVGAFDTKVKAGCVGGVWLHPNNYEIVRQPLDILQCPSDSEGSFLHNHRGCGGVVSRGNYAGFFGNVNMGAATYEDAADRELHRDAAFTMNDAVGLRHITDGSSNTMIIGELLKGIIDDNDYRGVHWYDHVGTSQIFTTNPPNSPEKDRLYPLWCNKTTHRPDLNLPCRPGRGNGRDNHAASRSRHPGGVHVGLADGSARFASEDVDPEVWQAMGSINHGEVVELP